MKILFVPYRFGRRLSGGAELYHIQLVKNLLRSGHDVDVLTTTAGGFELKTRFGVLWREEFPPSDDSEDLGEGLSCRVIRRPVRNPSLPSLWLACRHLQKRFEAEQLIFQPRDFLPVERPVAFTGWHFPEVHGSQVWRWSGDKASILLPPGARCLHLGGLAPRRRTMTISTGGGVVHRADVQGQFYVKSELPADTRCEVLWLETPVGWWPAKDVRTLGLFINSLAADTAEGTLTADLWEDYRQIVSRHYMIETPIGSEQPDGWVEHRRRIATARPSRFCTLFDKSRGPHSPSLDRWLRANAHRYDLIIAANFPFSPPSIVFHRREKLRRPLALLPLMHLDDEFYYWKHYLDFLSTADVVLTISRYSEGVFSAWGARARFIGVGIEPDMLAPADAGQRAAFRSRAGLAPDEPFMLTVCRKTPTKNYQSVIRAVERLQSESPVRLVFIGPEEDGTSIDYSFIIRLEGLDRQLLKAAYAEASAFALMSENESFGMVFLEAWSQGTPVVGSAWCRPVAALISQVNGGFLARDAEDLSRHLAWFLTHREEGKALGLRGQQAIFQEWTSDAMTARLNSALQSICSHSEAGSQPV
ncbi:MAG: hypothetical protein Kow0059_04080 [Candidatus Sumerlaeia bacterium]